MLSSIFKAISAFGFLARMTKWIGAFGPFGALLSGAFEGLSSVAGAVCRMLGRGISTCLGDLNTVPVLIVAFALGGWYFQPVPVVEKPRHSVSTKHAAKKKMPKPAAYKAPSPRDWIEGLF